MANYLKKLAILTKGFCLGLTLSLALPVAIANAATFTVDDTGHTADANAGDGSCADSSGDCTLRAAIEETNSLAGADTIQFDGSTFSSATTINTTTVLTLSGGSTTIDGGSNHYVVVNGSGTGSHNCFDITSASNIIKGLVIQNCNDGVDIKTSSATGNRIENNYIGTNATASSAVGNSIGVTLQDSATSNIIGTNGDGTNDSSEGNIISGNTNRGIYVIGSGTTGNRVAGNYIGINAAGNAAIANGNYGIRVQNEASLLTIGTNGDGTSDADERNIISGNTNGEISIGGSSSDTTGHTITIAGNYISLNASGTTQLSAASSMGINIWHSANNRVGTNGDGTSDSLERNVIAGNGGNSSIYLNQSGSSNNLVAGNYIGLNAAGDTGMAHFYGVYISGPNNTVGYNGVGNASSMRNIIAGSSSGHGVFISGSSATGNKIRGNYIGLNASGDAAIANNYGVHITGAGSNTIGTDGDGSNDSSEGNVISGNNREGVYITGSGATSNVIAGNYIGMGPGGSGDFGNNRHGIYILSSAANNIIGGDIAAEANEIAYNGDGSGEYGIYVAGASSDGNQILRNSIHDNQNEGIELDGAGANNDIAAPANLTVNGINLTSDSVSANATVQIFHADDNSSCEGETYVGAVTADGSGNWSFYLPGSFKNSTTTYFVATQTTTAAGTSEFSSCYTGTFFRRSIMVD